MSNVPTVSVIEDVLRRFVISIYKTTNLLPSVLGVVGWCDGAG